MSFKTIFKNKTIFGLLLAGALFTAAPAMAQQPDTTVASTTAAADSASKASPTTTGTAMGADSTAAAGPTLIETSVDTTALSYAQLPPDWKPEKNFTEAYRSAAYYFLLFFLVCVFLGIIGKVLRVYELSSEMQGRKS